jgi:hypothetical protein
MHPNTKSGKAARFEEPKLLYYAYSRGIFAREAQALIEPAKGFG